MESHSPSGASIAPQVETEFFAVSPRKFAFMSVATFGIYELYWAYKQWVVIKNKTGEGIMPFWRAVFGGLWGFSLFSRIKVFGEQRGISVTWNGGLLGLAYFVLLASYRLPDPYWLVDMLSFLPIMPVLRTIEGINNAPPHLRNDSFSAANITAIVLGGLFWAMVVLGLMAPEVPT